MATKTSTSFTDIKEDSLEGKFNGTYAIQLSYQEKVEALKKKLPNCLVIPKLAWFPEYLQEYRYSLKDFQAVFPWSASTINKLVRPQLPFILITATIRRHFDDMLQQLPVDTRKANYLFSIRELQGFMAQNLESYLTSVQIPISLFVASPSEFQKDFVQDKEAYLGEKQKIQNRTKGHGSEVTTRIRNITDWPSVVKHVPQEIRKILGSWNEDVEKLRQENQLSERQRLPLTKLRVHLPEGVLPKFYTLTDIAERGNCTNRSSGERFVLREGWVRHELQGANKVAFTAGPMLGVDANWEDYRIGATVTVTVERALTLVRKEHLTHAKRWLLCNEDIYWQKGTFTADAYQKKSDMAWLFSTRT